MRVRYSSGTGLIALIFAMAFLQTAAAAELGNIESALSNVTTRGIGNSSTSTTEMIDPGLGSTMLNKIETANMYIQDAHQSILNNDSKQALMILNNASEMLNNVTTVIQAALSINFATAD